jgi:hypothetical protein
VDGLKKTAKIEIAPDTAVNAAPEPMPASAASAASAPASAARP